MNYRKISLSILVLLILYSCSRQNESAKNDLKAYQADTAYVNRILKMSESNAFSHPDSVIFYLDKIRGICEKIGYQKGISGCAYQTGNEFYRQHNYSTALAQFEDVIKIAAKQKDTLLKARCLTQMASIALDLGDDHKAMRQYYEALSLYEQIGNKAGIAEVCNVIGGNNIHMQKFDSAASYLQRAIHLNKEIGNQAGIFHNQANLAFLYHFKDENDKARAIYAELIPALIQMGDSINLATVYSHFSLYYQWIAKPDSSLLYLRKSIVIMERLNENTSLPTFYGMLGMIFLDNKDYDSASFYLVKSTRLARELNDFLTVRQAMLLLLSLDTITGNYAGAAGKLPEILAMNDSVYTQRIRNNLEASALRYENQKKNNLIEIQVVKLSTVTKQRQLLYLLFSAALLLCLLLFLLILLFRRNNRKKHELLNEKLRNNELLIEKNRTMDEINRLRAENAEKGLIISEKENLSNTLALEQKNELLGMISDRINKTAMSADAIKESDLNAIRSSIRMQMRDNEDNNLFNQKFIALHPNFFSGIKEKHPDLTRSELRFCAYLRLDLDSKQIANILNVTQEAIRKTRYRIRKKLHLETEDSLEGYISTF